MTVTSLASIVTNTANSPAASSDSSNSANSNQAVNDASSAYNTFLTLLTTELQNQDPLNPTDTGQFTNQLISLAGVEQQENMSSQLSSIASTLNTYGLSNGVAYIDKTISYDSATAPVQNGSANWSYSLPADAASTKLTITDANGDTVWSGTGDTASGSHSFSWDGTDTDGTTNTSGAFTLNVTSVDSSGASITTTVSSIGNVTGVDTSSGTTKLQLGDDVSVALSDVTGVRSATN